jgi:hypothetical protein
MALIRDNFGEVEISKVSAERCRVDCSWFPPAIWEGEYTNELATLIQQAVDTKIRKLQRVGIAPQTALLLLYDAYLYADPQGAAAAIAHVQRHDWFHSVFWAASFAERHNTEYPEQPGREGVFLYSIRDDWLRSAQ